MEANLSMKLTANPKHWGKVLQDGKRITVQNIEALKKLITQLYFEVNKVCFVSLFITKKNFFEN